MGLFKKKFDFEKHHLRIVFSLDEMKYIIFYGQHRIQYNDLTRRTKKILDDMNSNLKNDSRLLNEEINKAKIKLRFNKLQSLGYSNISFEYLGTVNGTMSKEMEHFLNKLTSEDNILLGINRVGENISDNRIQDTFKNGLLITGHSVVTSAIKALDQNVSYYSDNKIIIKELMYANTYKNSKGSFLIRIPDEDLKGNIFIYDNDGNMRLNPKYVLGYVPVQANHHIENIILNEYYKLEYSYVWDGNSRVNSQHTNMDKARIK